MMMKTIVPISKQRTHRFRALARLWRGTTGCDIQTAVAPLQKGNDRSLRGFTLVELMVVMAMTAIMIGVTLTSLSGARERKAVETEARKMAATIREVQNYALTGKAINTLGYPTCAVGIKAIGSGTTSFRLRYMYRSSGATSCATGFTISSDGGPSPDPFNALRPLAGGVQFGSDTSSDIFFSVPRGELVDSARVAITTAQLIVLQKGTASYSICVYPSGMVTETAGILGSCP